MATKKLTPKQIDVLLYLSNHDGAHYRSPYFVIGRSNGKLRAADALKFRKLITFDDDFTFRITDAGRAALKAAQS